MADPVLFPVPAEANAEALEFIDNMAAKVRSGALRAVFFAGVSPNGDIHSGFVPAGRLFELIGAVEAAKYRLMVANVEVRKDETLI